MSRLFHPGYRQLLFLDLLLCMVLQSFSLSPAHIEQFDRSLLTNRDSLFFEDRIHAAPEPGDLYVEQALLQDSRELQAEQSISLEVQLLNCQAWENCNANPQVEFAIKGEEHRSLAGPLIVQIGADRINCDNQFCIVDMPLTNDAGEIVNYWVESLDGTVLIYKSFKMRNRIVDMNASLHYFEVIGDDFPYPIDVCANVWEIFPDESDLKLPWLRKAVSADDLNTDVDYALLAGKLIWYGYVDARACSDGGMLANGSASTCGIEMTREKLIEWQNKYNQQILESANQIDIPPRVVKGLVAQESQFWPDWKNGNEYGYGMISDLGMDMLLTWNTDFFLELCMTYYPKSTCMGGYSSLPLDKQSFLRGICLADAGTEEEFQIIANTLKAGCYQTLRLVENITDELPGNVFTYTDLWRINLGIYNTGAGCMGEAIECAWEEYDRAMTWEEFVQYIPAYCTNAATYFDKVTFYGSVTLDQ